MFIDEHALNHYIYSPLGITQLLVGIFARKRKDRIALLPLLSILLQGRHGTREPNLILISLRYANFLCCQFIEHRISNQELLWGL